VSSLATAVVWGSVPPVVSIGYEDERFWPGDSGLSVLFSDAPDPDDVGPGHDPRVGLVHLGCLLDENPGLGLGIAVAQEHGAADLGEDGSWVGRPADG